jgi:hypothetical protein
MTLVSEAAANTVILLPSPGTVDIRVLPAALADPLEPLPGALAALADPLEPLPGAPEAPAPADEPEAPLPQAQANSAAAINTTSAMPVGATGSRACRSSARLARILAE